MMQCVLSHKTWRWVVATHRLLAGASLANPPGVLCLFAPHLPRLAGHRLLSTSASGHAAQYPKQQKLHPPPGKEPRPSPAPCDHAGDDGARRMETDQPGFASEVDPLQDRSIGLFQRFKKTFKQYGKVMIPVHLATSSVWFGMFYYAAMKGVNVVPFLELMGLPESLVGLLRDSSSGYALTAYAMYKIATPARYTATLGGTSLSVQYLRKHGYFSTPPPVKDYIQDKMEETKEKLTEKMEETKEKLTEKMEETKERLSEKMEETKDKFSEKLQETKDKVSEGKAFFRKKAD